MKLPMHRTLVARLTGLFALLLMLFAAVLELLFNAMMERKMIAHYSKTMQRNAYAISQNLSEMIAPSDYEALDETPFIVGEDTLAPYMALIEHITNCNVYLIDEQHRVTGYFDGVVQTMSGKVLPSYIEQTIALGFMGKTPFLSAKIDGETHLTTSMPIMNAKSHVLGVVLLESTLRELGFAQVSSSDILLFSGAVAFALTALLGALFSRMFTQPITAVQRFAGRLASGEYDARMQNARKDEIGELARSMDILAERLDDARRRDERLREQQSAFFATISHELKTPVTVIRGSLEALRDGVVSGEDDVRAYIDAGRVQGLAADDYRPAGAFAAAKRGLFAQHGRGGCARAAGRCGDERGRAVRAEGRGLCLQRAPMRAANDGRLRPAAADAARRAG